MRTQGCSPLGQRCPSSPFSPFGRKAVLMGDAGLLPPQETEAPGWGEGQPMHQSLWHREGCGRAGAGQPPSPSNCELRTAKCVSWTRIQGNCVSPHSVCSEANAFLSYCLCRSLVVDTPITSSLGERPRCSESGCGRPDSKQGERQPGGSILVSRGRSTGHGHAA